LLLPPHPIRLLVQFGGFGPRVRISIVGVVGGLAETDADERPRWTFLVLVQRRTFHRDARMRGLQIATEQLPGHSLVAVVFAPLLEDLIEAVDGDLRITLKRAALAHEGRDRRCEITHRGDRLVSGFDACETTL